METTSFYRDTWAEINLDHIYNNVKNVKGHLPAHVTLYAVVKANAYGHGYEETARTALEGGANALAAAFLDEAVYLRNKGFSCPILVLGASRPEDAEVAANLDISLTVFNLEWLQEARKSLTGGKAVKLHIKCDTGMGRLGFTSAEELREAERLITSSDLYDFEGIFTHFAAADEEDSSYYELQLKRFREFLEALTERPRLIHASNSAATLRFKDSQFNAARLGIAMYGLSPSEEIKPHLPFELHQAMSLKTKVVSIKKLSKGDRISYGGVYTLQGDEWIAALPVGYADGFLRKLQGQEVLVQGRRVPIVGRICMDQCMIRLPEKVDIGTEVTLVGRDGDEFISLDEIAGKLGTINYEAACLVAWRVPRVYKKYGKTHITNNSLLE
ncbi:alanine racemase [Peribacillus sp. SCS-37]|uniref:alanine racemase n=1 Tax=Paraperibacillus esterisolvens TaxID=3115296 RepID=UPI003905B787